MSTSELAFLALGAALGVAAGAALLRTLIGSGRGTREVRVTITADSVPRRVSATLAVPPGRQADLPAAGGPGEPPAQRTWAPVPITIHAEPDPDLESLRRFAAGLAARPTPGPPSLVPMTAAGVAARASAGGPDTSNPAPRTTSVAASDPPGSEPVLAVPRETHARAGGPADPGAGDLPLPGGPCAELRRIAQERRELARIAREQADLARMALTNAQGEYDRLNAEIGRLAASIDTQAIRRQKDAAQAALRRARADAGTRETVEDAARVWLGEINRINLEARTIARSVDRERTALEELGTRIERLAAEADGARSSADGADAAAGAAEGSLADCEAAAGAAAAGAVPVPAAIPQEPGAPLDDTRAQALVDALAPAEPADADALRLATGAGVPTIVRLLRGDRAAMVRVAEQLGGEHPLERARWQRELADLIDAIVARAIEAASLDFPPDHPFWSMFTRQQCRDIAAALASLGYRFDGVDGWLDGRMPSQRDLSMAVGYGGFDPMRIRRWPKEAEMRRLFEGVTVAADEFLAGAAGGLTLGELVDLLERRADALSGLWNEWPRVRPLLLATNHA